MDISKEFGKTKKLLTEILEKHNESLKWMYENMEEIQEKYETKFIAIYNKMIVGAKDNRKELSNFLKQKYSADELEEILH
ncbi:MAG: hypothetical protein BAJALOKI1v1_2010005 [Promethearchaeota archaeon]|nr:MAG: hypothetical protein BAJALOKI1v1_2010005 [Candidatus Lokiarchaeota archaeon]